MEMWIVAFTAVAGLAAGVLVAGVLALDAYERGYREGRDEKRKWSPRPLAQRPVQLS